MQDIYDPFSYLLNEIRAHDAGLRDWSPGQREHYLAELQADEAQELAWGRRHLTVVHGPVTDDSAAAQVDELIANLDQFGCYAHWTRLGGVPNHQLTLTVGGPDADQLIEAAAEVVRQLNPGHWWITATAYLVPAR